MPAEALDQRSRQRIERADEQSVVDRALPPAVQPRLHGKAFGHDPDFAKSGQQRRNSPTLNFRSTGASSCSRPTFISFESAFSHDTRLYTWNTASPARLQDAAHFVDEPLRVRGVLDDAVGEDEVERGIAERQMLAIGDAEDPRAAPAARSSRAPASIADGATSTPVTTAPPLAKRARSTPAPQPTSRTVLPR